MMERSFQLITSITKVCLFRRSLGVFMETLFGGEMSYHQVSCLLRRKKLFNKLSHGTLSPFMNTTDYYNSDSTNHRSI